MKILTLNALFCSILSFSAYAGLDCSSEINVRSVNHIRNLSDSQIESLVSDHCKYVIGHKVFNPTFRERNGRITFQQDNIVNYQFSIPNSDGETCVQLNMLRGLAIGSGIRVGLSESCRTNW